MKVCGIVISKRRITLSLVHHYKVRPISEGAMYRLDKVSTVYISKQIRLKPIDLDYKIKSLPLIQEADFIHIVYDYRQNLTGHTLAFKEIMYLMLTDFLEQSDKKYVAESVRAIKYRMAGKGRFARSDKILQWMHEKIDNFSRIKILGKKQEDYQKLLSILAACSSKGITKRLYNMDIIKIKE